MNKTNSEFNKENKCVLEEDKEMLTAESVYEINK